MHTHTFLHFSLVKSFRGRIAPNFNFLGQLHEYERELLAQQSRDPVDDTIAVSTTATATLVGAGIKRVCTAPAITLASPVSDRPLKPLPPSSGDDTGKNAPTTRRPSINIPGMSPLKRDRPTYLDLDTPPLTVDSTSLAGRVLSQQFPHRHNMDSSPSEGKRSRISLMPHAYTTAGSLLPSPCTFLSHLELSSPSEGEQRRSLGFTPVTPVGSHPSPLTTTPLLDVVGQSQITRTSRSLPYEDIDNVPFVVCSVMEHDPVTTSTRRRGGLSSTWRSSGADCLRCDDGETSTLAERNFYSHPMATATDVPQVPDFNVLLAPSGSPTVIANPIQSHSNEMPPQPPERSSTHHSVDSDLPPAAAATDQQPLRSREGGSLRASHSAPNALQLSASTSGGSWMDHTRSTLPAASSMDSGLVPLVVALESPIF